MPLCQQLFALPSTGVARTLTFNIVFTPPIGEPGGNVPIACEFWGIWVSLDPGITLQVDPPQPTLTAISTPAGIWDNGATVPFTITGQWLAPGGTLTISGSDVTVQSFTVQGGPNSLITGTLAFDDTAPQTTYTITYTTVGQYSPGILLSAGLLTAFQPRRIAHAPQITVTAVQFTNSYALAKDNGQINPPPLVSSTVWQSSCSSCTNQAAFYQGQTIQATITVTLSTASAYDLTNVRLEGSMGSLGTLSGNNVIPAGTTSAFFTVTSDTALPIGTQLYNPLNINWSVGLFAANNLPCAQITCTSAGNSASPVYVTMALPPNTNIPLPLTTLFLAVGAGGAPTKTQAFLNTWGKFTNAGTGPANVLTWDNRQLFYYKPNVPYNNNCALNSNYLLNVYNGNGQCGAFASLLLDALQANGIAAVTAGVASLNGDRFLVNSWLFAGNDSAYAPYISPLVLETETTGGIGMVPLPVGSLFGQMVSQTGSPGQNSPTPAEKVFSSHYIVKLTDTMVTGVGGPYFDPSYGLTYLNECDPAQGFEHKALAGYARSILSIESPPSFHARTTSSGSCSMSFSQ